MRRLTFYLLAGFFIAALLTACEEEEVIPKPENLLPEAAYIDLLVEFQMLDALHATTDSVSNADSLEEALFRHYNTTDSIFFASHRYYQSRIREHNARLDTVLKRIEHEQEEMNQAVSSEPDGRKNPGRLESD